MDTNPTKSIKSSIDSTTKSKAKSTKHFPKKSSFFQNLIVQISHFSELVAFKHTIFSASFILIAMCVASVQRNASIWVGWGTFFLCTLALITARNFAMAFNRFCDRHIDARNPRTTSRPSVDGRISSAYVVIFCVINAL